MSQISNNLLPGGTFLQDEFNKSSNYFNIQTMASQNYVRVSSGSLNSNGGFTVTPSAQDWYWLSDAFTLEAGTYTIYATVDFGPVIYLYQNGAVGTRYTGFPVTITLSSQTTCQLRVGGNVTGSTYNCNYITVNKGSVNLPYQPYYGPIMHELNCYNKTEIDTLLNAKANDPIVHYFDGNPIWTYLQTTKFYTLPTTSGVHSYIITGVVSYARATLYSWVMLLVTQTGTNVNIQRISGNEHNSYSASGVDLYVYQGQADSTLRLYGACYKLF